MNEGWIKIHRQIKEWQHYQEPNVLLVWLDLLTSANAKEGWWHGRKIRRGELFTSVESIHQNTGLDAKTVRKALAILEASGEIKREATNAGSKIIINQYNKFQSWGNDTQQLPQQLPQRDTQPIPQPTPQRLPYKQEYKEVKERKEEKNINFPIPHARAREIGIEAFGSFSNVFLFPAEHRTMTETYGQDLTDKAIDDLSCKLAEGDEQALNSRNHYATLDRWLRYKRETGKVTMTSTAADPFAEREKDLRIVWKATSEKGKQEYLDTHEGLLPWEYERKHKQQ